MCLAIPGRVVALAGGTGIDRRGTVDYDGVRQEVSLAYLPETQIGDYVLVHVGFAMSVINEAEARDSLEALQNMFDVEPDVGALLYGEER